MSTITRLTEEVNKLAGALASMDSRLEAVERASIRNAKSIDNLTELVAQYQTAVATQVKEDKDQRVSHLQERMDLLEGAWSV